MEPVKAAAPRNSSNINEHFAIKFNSSGSGLFILGILGLSMWKEEHKDIIEEVGAVLANTLDMAYKMKSKTVCKVNEMLMDRATINKLIDSTYSHNMERLKRLGVIVIPEVY